MTVQTLETLSQEEVTLSTRIGAMTDFALGYQRVSQPEIIPASTVDELRLRFAKVIARVTALEDIADDLIRGYSRSLTPTDQVLRGVFEEVDLSEPLSIEGIDLTQLKTRISALEVRLADPMKGYFRGTAAA
jgi:hypothetical protein